MENLTINEYIKKKLDDTYLAIFAIKNEVNIKKGECIEQNYIYTFVGIDKKGFRQLINVYQEKTSNSRYWLDVFESLKARGLKNVLFISVDDNKNLKRTAKIAFPNVVFVDSMTDIMPLFYKYTSTINQRCVGTRLIKLYLSNSINDYKVSLEMFKKEFNNSIHQKLIKKYLVNVEALYKYSINIRKLLYSYSANISLYDKIRLTFNHHKNYINDLNEIFDKIGDINKYFGFNSFKKKQWTNILNDLIQLYPNIDFI